MISHHGLSGILPQGFRACGLNAGIKKSGKPDLALLFSAFPCVAVGFFTSNRVKAAPVDLCIRHLAAASPRAVIINSGNANCVTGPVGRRDCLQTARACADVLGLRPREVLVSSTGIIGQPLPMEKIRKAIPLLAAGLSTDGFVKAARAMMTTDAFVKVSCRTLEIGGRPVVISAMAKGAGMIAPSVKCATMLVYVMTDARISRVLLRSCAQQAVETSFNAISVDGCMSTNDTVLFLANGAAVNKTLTNCSKDFEMFTKSLTEVCLDLAKMIVEDGEGATKLIQIKVQGASSAAEARRLAFSVADSNLFKCAMFGQDPNWGRIVAALGSIDSCLQLDKLDVSLNQRMVLKKGSPVLLSDRDFLKGKNIDVLIDLHAGRGRACVYASDLSHEYVKINADYS